jgi:hypothetical protein
VTNICHRRSLVRNAWILRAIAAIAFLFLSAHQAGAAIVTATWDRNPESYVTGYVLYYGTQSGNYSTNVDVGNVITYQLNLGAGQRYYFAVRAYDSYGRFSPYSAEVFADVVGPAAPVITSLSPTSGTSGTAVTISGSSFGSSQGTSTVRFNGTTATVTSWNATSIVATVPGGATTGPVVVTVNAVASNGVQFTVSVSSSPTITSLSPTSGTVGASVTIAGTNFGATQGTSSVRFNGTTASPTSWSATSIVAAVPSGATTGAVVVTVNGVASNGVTFTVTAPGSLPAPWTTQDIGSPAVAGQATYASGTFTVVGAGEDIWGSNDEFRFVYRTLDGDGEIVARVASLQNTDSWAQAGVMIREDLTGNAPNAIAEVTAGNGFAFQHRDARGGPTESVEGFPGTAPQWVRLTRAGNTLRGYYSATGSSWTLMGTFTVPLPTSVYVGLAVTSRNPSVTTTATFSNVTVTGGAPPPNQAPILTQPVNQTSAEGTTVSLQLAASDPDGNPLTYSATGLPASLSVNPTSGLIAGTLTFTSAGVYNVTATASDGALSNSRAFTWTVVDVPQAPTITSLSPMTGAVGASVTIAGMNFGTTQGTSSIRFNGTTATPTSWSATSIVAAVPSGATTGAVVVTVNDVASNGVTFIITMPGPLPAPWTSQDVGSPGIAGQATYSAGTFNIAGAGVDIGGTSDQFRFAYQALDGNGEIVARVDSLQNTDAWAKAGVMVRRDLSPNARYVMAEVTAASGMVLQSRATKGGSSTLGQSFPGAPPQWLRLVRSGNTLSGMDPHGYAQSVPPHTHLHRLGSYKPQPHAHHDRYIQQREHHGRRRAELDD